MAEHQHLLPFDALDDDVQAIHHGLTKLAENNQAIHHGLTQLLSSCAENTLLLRKILDLLPPLPQDEQPPEQHEGLLVSNEIEKIEIIVEADVFDEMPKRVNTVTTAIEPICEASYVDDKVFEESSDDVSDVSIETVFHSRESYVEDKARDSPDKLPNELRTGYVMGMTDPFPDFDDPYGFRLLLMSEWKYLRALCRTELFSTKAIESHAILREKTVAEMVEFLGVREGKVVNIGEAVFATVFNILGNLFFSRDVMNIEDAGLGHGLKCLVWKMMEIGATPYLPDYFPIWDPQGLKRKILQLIKEMFATWDSDIKERRESQVRESSKTDFLDVFIANGFDDQKINWLFLELFTAGTDTTTVTVEWAMAELVKNKEVMTKVRQELREFNQNSIKDSQVGQLQYLNACVKETLRLQSEVALKDFTSEVATVGAFAIGLYSLICIIDCSILDENGRLINSIEESVVLDSRGLQGNYFWILMLLSSSFGDTNYFIAALMFGVPCFSRVYDQPHINLKGLAMDFLSLHLEVNVGPTAVTKLASRDENQTNHVFDKDEMVCVSPSVNEFMVQFVEMVCLRTIVAPCLWGIVADGVKFVETCSLLFLNIEELIDADDPYLFRLLVMAHIARGVCGNRLFNSLVLAREHPAFKILIDSVDFQSREIGDATSLIFIKADVTGWEEYGDIKKSLLMSSTGSINSATDGDLWLVQGDAIVSQCDHTLAAINVKPFDPGGALYYNRDFFKGSHGCWIGYFSNQVCLLLE